MRGIRIRVVFSEAGTARLGHQRNEMTVTPEYPNQLFDFGQNAGDDLVNFTGMLGCVGIVER